MSYFASTEYLIEVEKGNVSGSSIVHKFGRNTGVGTTFEPISLIGSYWMPKSNAGSTLRVKAGNFLDSSALAGARQVTVEGLDSTGAFATETLATNGSSAGAAGSTTFMRVFRAWVSESGTYATNTADSQVASVTVEVSGGGTDVAQCIYANNFGRGQSEIGAYSVPLGKTAYLVSGNAYTDSSKTTEILFAQRQSILDTSAPYEAMRVFNEREAEGGVVPFRFDRSAQAFPALTDIIVWGRVDTGSATVTVSFDMLLVDD